MEKDLRKIEDEHLSRKAQIDSFFENLKKKQKTEESAKKERE